MPFETSSITSVPAPASLSASLLTIISPVFSPVITTFASLVHAVFSFFFTLFPGFLGEEVLFGGDGGMVARVL